MTAPRPQRQAAAPAWSAAEIGRAATLALHDELALAPKPGLVSFIDTGSHADMDAHSFMRSLFALRKLDEADWSAARGAYAEFALAELPG